jgi:hypothetical protein
VSGKGKDSNQEYVQCLGEAMAPLERARTYSLCFLGVLLLEKASKADELQKTASEHDEIMDPGNDASRSLAQQQCAPSRTSRWTQ